MIFVYDMSRIYKCLLLDAAIFTARRNTLYVVVRQYICRFRLTLRSIVQQLDDILEKHTDGLYSISENRIVKQFMVLITIVCGEGIIMAFCCKQQYSANTVRVQYLYATVLNLWLEVKYKNFLVKKFYFKYCCFLRSIDTYQIDKRYYSEK